MKSGETFRNEQVAAPLKLDLDVELLVLPAGAFRNEQVAAPLKRGLCLGSQGTGRHSATNKLRPH